MRRQKGQAIVEFALVFPLLLFLLWGLIYTGLLYRDYLNLSNLARDSARAASIQGTAQYENIRVNRANQIQPILTNLYTWNGDRNSFQIENEDNSSVKVTLTTNLNVNFPGVGVLDFFGIPLPRNFSIVYSMHKETT